METQIPLYPYYVRRLIPEPVINRCALKGTEHIPAVHTRLVSTSKSFIPSTMKLWNRLPLTTVLSPTFLIFKKLITSHTPKPSTYNTSCISRHGIWLSRLRMGLSALCQHRFTYNLIDSPNCPHCGEPETMSHYFFYCPEYVQARTALFDSL